MHKFHSFFVLLTASFLCMFSTTSSAQDIPTDGLLPGNNGSWSNDTIIRSYTPILGTGHNIPARSCITAIYSHGYILITSTAENLISYKIYSPTSTTEVQGRLSVNSSSPALINLTTLPTGHYTLLLYINNECLEGEFEKEY